MLLLTYLFCCTGILACLLCSATWESEDNPYRAYPVEQALPWVFALNPLYWGICLYTFISLWLAGDDDETP